MNEGYRCVIDSEGNYEAFISVTISIDEKGQPQESPEPYMTGDNKRLITAIPPSLRQHRGGFGIVSPKWDFEAKSWTEAATADEIAAWESEHPAPPTPALSMQEQQFAVMALQQAEQATQINQLQQANAMLMLQLAESQKGGADNV